MEDSVLHRLRVLLANKGIPQLRIAEATGIKQNTFSRQVNGESALSGAVISAVVKYFPDASAEWILTGNGSMLKSIPSTATATDNNINYHSSDMENNLVIENEVLKRENELLKEQLQRALDDKDKVMAMLDKALNK